MIILCPISLAVSDVCSSCDNCPLIAGHKIRCLFSWRFSREVSFSRSVAVDLDMKLFCAGLVLLLVCVPESELKMRSLLAYEPEVHWNTGRDDLVQTPTSADPNNTLPESQRVPHFLVISSSNDPVEAFKPELGARELPEAVKEMLLQALGATPATPAPPTGGVGKPVEVRCHIDKMFVRVKKSIFKAKTPCQDLKLGLCTVNKISDSHYYFLYPLNANCGFQTLVSKGIFIFTFNNLDVLERTLHSFSEHCRLFCSYNLASLRSWWSCYKGCAV